MQILLATSETILPKNLITEARDIDVVVMFWFDVCGKPATKFTSVILFVLLLLNVPVNSYCNLLFCGTCTQN